MPLIQSAPLRFAVTRFAPFRYALFSWHPSQSTSSAAGSEVVGPVFGNIDSNKGLDRFSLRSKKKVQGQWQLYCLVHNIEKLANYGQLAA
nr:MULTISPECIES: transposase [unclassified Marinobacter]